MTFWSCRKNALIRTVNFKIYDVTNWLTITIHILPNISGSKNSHTMKLANKRIIPTEIFFLKNYAENEAERLVPNFFLFFKYA